MKNECNIINDMLPLYNENIASDDTRVFVEEHLENCPECRDKLRAMQTPTPITENFSAAPLKTLKRKLVKRRVETIVFTAALMLAILVSAFSFLTAPQYFSAPEEILDIRESENGEIIITFSDAVTGYDLDTQLHSGTSMYHISAWSTTWDQYFSVQGPKSVILQPVAGKPFAVYYSLNDSTESILLYGTSPQPNMGVALLPRLALSYYFGFAVFAFVVLAVLWFLLRKKQTVKIWVERIWLIPVAYMLGHFSIKGFSMATYSLRRDVSIILLAAVLFYLAGLIGISLYRAKKENNNNGNFA